MNNILFFTDLEGTILREKDGEYNDNEMFAFLEQLLQLEENTGAKVHIHIVSPVDIEMMKEIIAKIDKNIGRFNSLKKVHLKPIEGAVASFGKEFIEKEHTYDRIIPFSEPIDTRNPDMGKYGKVEYVGMWMEAYDNVLGIYAGNGRNDIWAMQNIKKQKGFVICPKNSRTEVKKIADFVSDGTDIRGITDCLDRLNKEIIKRKSPEIKEKVELESKNRE